MKLRELYETLCRKEDSGVIAYGFADFQGSFDKYLILLRSYDVDVKTMRETIEAALAPKYGWNLDDEIAIRNDTEFIGDGDHRLINDLNRLPDKKATAVPEPAHTNPAVSRETFEKLKQIYNDIDRNEILLRLEKGKLEESEKAIQAYEEKIARLRREFADLSPINVTWE